MNTALFLKRINLYTAEWCSLDEALSFPSEMATEDYFKTKRADNYWIDGFCKIQYIHPLNLKRNDN